MTPKVRLIASLLFLCMCAAHADNIIVRPFTREAMIPSGVIFDMVQDDDGFMWYGTSEGLCRDDGYSIHVLSDNFHFRQPLLTNEIRNIADDHRGHLFLGTPRGLYILDRRSGSIDVFPDSAILRFDIKATLATADGELWVATDGMILRYDSLAQRKETIRHPWKGAPCSIGYLYEDKTDGSVWWVVWQKGLVRYNRKTGTITEFDGHGSIRPTSIIRDNNNPYYWVATLGKGIMRFCPDPKYNISQWQSQPSTCTADGTLRCEPIHLLQDNRRGYVWSVNSDNIYVYSIDADGNLQPLCISPEWDNCHHSLGRPFCDADGNVWVAGSNPLLTTFSFDSKHAEHHTLTMVETEHKMPVSIDGLQTDRDSSFWLRIPHLGFGHYDIRSDSFLLCPGDQHKMSEMMNICNAGGIYAVRNRSEVVRYMYVDKHIEEEPSVDCTPMLAPKEIVRTVFEDKDGHLLIGTSCQLLCYDTHKHLLTSMWKDIGKVTSIDKGQDGTIYLISEDKGLLSIKDKEKRVVATSQSPFKSLTISPDGMLWANTQHGNLVSISPSSGEVMEHGHECGLTGNQILQLKSDSKGNIWMLTAKDIIVYHTKEQYCTLLSKDDEEIRIVHFLAMCVDCNNRVSVGGNGGFVSFDASTMLTSEKSQNPLRVTGLRIGNDMQVLNLPSLSTYTLPSNRRSVQLHFSTLNPLSAHRTHYAFRMKNGEWSNLQQGQNSLYLSDLSAGHNRIQLRSTDTEGRWNNDVYIIDLYVTPYWHELWWVRTLFALFILALAVWWVRQRIVRRRQERERRIAQMVVAPIDNLLETMQQTHNDEETHTNKRAVIETLQSIQHCTAALTGGEELSAHDQHVLKQATSLIEQHLSDSDYTIEQLASDMAMSRVNLFRKIRNITGVSPSEFVKNIRLEHAARLLTKGELNVNGVSLSVGFNTPSYFAKSFKQRYGVQPSDYASKMQHSNVD